MQHLRRSTENLDRLKKQFPKDFNDGATTDWEHLIKKQHSIFKPDTKGSLRNSTVKSQHQLASELGKQTWEKYQFQALKDKEELREEFEKNINNNIEMANEKFEKQEKDQYLKKHLFENYRQNNEQKRKVKLMEKEEFQKYEADLSK